MTTLLNYSIATTPSPLQAARSGALQLVVSNPEPEVPVTVFSITLTVAAGTTAADLAPSIDGIETPTPSDKWTTRTSGNNKYLATPASTAGVVVAGEGIAFRLNKIAVNDRVGATTIYIDEEAKTASGQRLTRSVEVVLAKFPSEFTLSALTAAPTTVERGGSTVLMWTGTNRPGEVTYDLEWASQGKPKKVPVDWIGPKTIENLDTTPTTTFTLTAQIANLPPQPRQVSVNVTQKPPVIDEFAAEIVGQEVVLQWKTRFGEVFLDTVSTSLRADGTTTLPLDRFRYTLRVIQGDLSARADLDLRLQKKAAVNCEGGTWVAAAALGERLIALADTELVVLDAKTLARQKVVASYSRMMDRPVLAVSRGGTRAYAMIMRSTRTADLVAWERTSYLYDGSFGVVASEPAEGPYVEAAMFSPDETMLYLASSHKRNLLLQVRRASNFEKVAQYDFGAADTRAWNTAMCASSDGKNLYLFTCEPDPSIRTIEAATGRLIAHETKMVAAQYGDSAFAYWRSGTDTRLAIAAGIDGVVVDAKTLKVVRILPKCGHLAVTATEIAALHTGQDGSLQLLDRATWAVEQKPEGLDRPIAVFAGPGMLYFSTAFGQSLTAFEGVLAQRTTVGRPAPVFEVMRGGDTVVVVGSGAPSRATISIEGDGVTLDATPGWTAARDGATYSLSRDDGADDDGGVVAFTFHGVDAGAAIEVV